MNQEIGVRRQTYRSTNMPSRHIGIPGKNEDNRTYRSNRTPKGGTCTMACSLLEQIKTNNPSLTRCVLCVSQSLPGLLRF